MDTRHRPYYNHPFSESALASASTSMPTNASPLELRIDLHNDFACLAHVTLTFTSGYPMMPQLDRADPNLGNLRNLLLSEFKDLESASALQKTGRHVRTLLEERLHSILHCVECCVLWCSAGTRHLWLDHSAASDSEACLERVPYGVRVLSLSGLSVVAECWTHCRSADC